MKSITQIKGYNVNERATWEIEEPSGNGIGTARSIAYLYSILVNDNCFGFGGASGSMAFSDPKNKIGYCYIPNMQGYDFPDSREKNIQRVLYECIERIKE